MTRWLVRILLSVAVLFLAAFWQLFLSTRPAITTDLATLAGDGSITRMDRICSLPESERIPEPRGPRLSLF